MVEYPNFVGPGKNPLMPDFAMAITPWHTLTLLDTFRQYNNAIETNYIALEAVLLSMVDILVSHIGTTPGTPYIAGGRYAIQPTSTPVTAVEKAALLALIQAVGTGTSDPDISPGGLLRPALSGALLTTQTMTDLTTGPFSLETFDKTL